MGELVEDHLEASLGTLYRDEGSRLWRAVFAFAHHVEVANDAVADAFAQCLYRGGAVRSPRAWVWKAAFRIAAGDLKERGRWRQLSDDRTYGIPEPSENLLQAIGQLSPHQRAALVLRHYAGYDAKAVADILGCSASTARVHLFRAVRRMRELLEANDD